jgi:hypothetical protein
MYKTHFNTRTCLQSCRAICRGHMSDHEQFHDQFIEHNASSIVYATLPFATKHKPQLSGLPQSIVCFSCHEKSPNLHDIPIYMTYHVPPTLSGSHWTFVRVLKGPSSKTIYYTIYRGETVMFSAFSSRVPVRSSDTAFTGHAKPLKAIPSAIGTSMMISFSVGFFSPLMALR